MKLMRVLIGVFCAAITLGAEEASAATIFEGRVFVVATTQACASGGYVYTGDNFTSVYRPKLSTNDPAEALTIVYPHAASILVTRAASGRLVNSPAVRTNFDGTLIGYNAKLSTWKNYATLLNTPAVLGANSDSVTITGAIEGFNVVGCTITIRGAYARSPFGG